MTVRIAAIDKEITDCYSVMRELRTHLARPDFLALVREQEQDGYRLAYVADEGRPVSVAGFRISRTLAWDRFLYVDDLVTTSRYILTAKPGLTRSALRTIKNKEALRTPAFLL